MEERKQKEREFSEFFRNENQGSKLGNQKYYSVVRSSRDYVNRWLKERVANRAALDYGCGNGSFTIFLAELGADASGVDISGISFHEAMETAQQKGVASRVHFYEMDCENMSFPDETFDIIVENGVLHHLDLPAAFAELARVVKRDGAVMCGEAIANNPIIQLYRRRTPQMRTEWETNHILHIRDLDLARKYFESVEVKFFHLFTLLAVPFRNSFLFRPLLKITESIDSVLLKIPGIRNQAWQMFFILSKPRRANV